MAVSILSKTASECNKFGLCCIKVFLFIFYHYFDSKQSHTSCGNSHSWAKFKILLVRKPGRKFYCFMAKFQVSGFTFLSLNQNIKVVVFPSNFLFQNIKVVVFPSIFLFQNFKVVVFPSNFWIRYEKVYILSVTINYFIIRWINLA